MPDYLNTFFFGVYPYIALAVMILGPRATGGQSVQHLLDPRHAALQVLYRFSEPHHIIACGDVRHGQILCHDFAKRLLCS